MDTFQGLRPNSIITKKGSREAWVVLACISPSEVFAQRTTVLRSGLGSRIGWLRAERNSLVDVPPIQFREKETIKRENPEVQIPYVVQKVSCDEDGAPYVILTQSALMTDPSEWY